MKVKGEWRFLSLRRLEVVVFFYELTNVFPLERKKCKVVKAMLFNDSRKCSI